MAPVHKLPIPKTAKPKAQPAHKLSVPDLENESKYKY